QEQSLAAGGRAVVAGAQDAMLNHIAEGFQLMDEAPPGPPFALRVGHQKLLLPRNPLARGGHATIQPHDTAGLLAALGDQRPPAADLLYVLQADDPGLADAGPLDHHPRQIANLLLARLAAGSLAGVGASGRCVEP